MFQYNKSIKLRNNKKFNNLICIINSFLIFLICFIGKTTFYQTQSLRKPKFKKEMKRVTIKSENKK